MNFPLIANVVVFAVLLFALAQTRHKQWSLAKKYWSVSLSALSLVSACSWFTAPTAVF